MTQLFGQLKHQSDGHSVTRSPSHFLMSPLVTDATLTTLATYSREFLMQDTKHKPGSIGLVISIALPMIISQAAETAMLFIDRLFLSSLGREHLSAAMGGGMMIFMFMTLFLGVIGYVTALAGQFYGAKSHDSCGKAGAQGLYLSFFSWPLLMCCIPLGLYLLRNAGHDPVQSELEISYFKILAFGTIFGLLRTAFSSFFSGIGKTRIVMISNLIALLVNVLANYTLIFGNFGCPAMGIEGAAIGTLIGSAVGMLIMALLYFSKETDKDYGTRNLGFDRAVCSKLLRFGVPAGLEFFLTMAAFNFFVQLIHSYGKDAAAAVTITFNWDLVSFLPLTGVSIAMTSLVGRYIGAKSPEDARKTVKSGLKIAMSYGLVMTIIFVTMTTSLVNVFSDGGSSEYEKVVPLAVTLLRLASIYIIADGILLTFTGALRGAGDTKWPMYVTVAIHWLMAIGCWIMAKKYHADVVTIWCVFIAFVCLMTAILALRYKSGKWQNILSEES